MLELRDRWLSLCKDLKVEGDPTKYYRVLNKCYSESHRYFHNFSHVEHCLKEYDNVKNLLDRPKNVEMALWWHDAKYDILAKNNEIRSAEMSRAALKEMRLTYTFSENVKDLIMVTLHNFTPKSKDGVFMADIDISGFGSPYNEYEKNEDSIRKEYISVPDEIFKPGRVEILRSFLGRPSIYYTDFFRNKYEYPARMNMERTVAKLSN